MKKNSSPWSKEQTIAVKELKKIAQNPPTLKIPGTGQRILQTDESDYYWGAIMIEHEGEKNYYCGHASGQFKEAKKHYHTTFKEALAVKNGIKKFDFHLRGHQFQVHMDNSSFPKNLEFKNKMPPDPQILRLNDWFSRYDFFVKHIKGKNNMIPDFLSRPNHKTVKVITSTHSFPLIFMAKPLSETTKTIKVFPPGLVTHTPAQILEYAKSLYFHFLHETMRFKHTPT